PPRRPYSRSARRLTPAGMPVARATEAARTVSRDLREKLIPDVAAQVVKHGVVETAPQAFERGGSGEHLGALLGIHRAALALDLAVIDVHARLARGDAHA